MTHMDNQFHKGVYELYGKPGRRGFEGGVNMVVNFTGGETWVPSLRAGAHGSGSSCAPPSAPPSTKQSPLDRICRDLALPWGEQWGTVWAHRSAGPSEISTACLWEIVLVLSWESLLVVLWAPHASAPLLGPRSAHLASPMLVLSSARASAQPSEPRASAPYSSFSFSVVVSTPAAF